MTSRRTLFAVVVAAAAAGGDAADVLSVRPAERLVHPQLGAVVHPGGGGIPEAHRGPRDRRGAEAAAGEDGGVSLAVPQLRRAS